MICEAITPSDARAGVASRGVAYFSVTVTDVMIT
jgi:hypothetical protein